MEIRSYQPEDAGPLGEVFHRAVRDGARGKYDNGQRAAWAPEVPGGASWSARLAGADTVVAADENRPVGFMTLDDKGYLDLAFVLPEHMGRGVSDLIYAVLEGRARAKRLAVLSTQASLLAEPFFARQGWSVLRRQEVEIRGAVLKNAWMEKAL